MHFGCLVGKGGRVVTCVFWISAEFGQSVSQSFMVKWFSKRYARLKVLWYFSMYIPVVSIFLRKVNHSVIAFLGMSCTMSSIYNCHNRVFNFLNLFLFLIHLYFASESVAWLNGLRLKYSKGSQLECMNNGNEGILLVYYQILVKTKPQLVVQAGLEL